MASLSGISWGVGVAVCPGVVWWWSTRRLAARAIRVSGGRRTPRPIWHPCTSVGPLMLALRHAVVVGVECDARVGKALDDLAQGASDVIFGQIDQHTCGFT